MVGKPTYEQLEQRVKELEKETVEHKQMEESLLREKNFSESIIDSLPGMFYFFDDTGKFLRWNKNFEKVSGHSTEEISGMSPLDFFEGEDKTIVAERIQEVFIKGKSSVEADFVSKNGNKTPYYFNGVLITIGDKNHLGGMGINITNRKKAETALRQSEEKYRKLYDESKRAEEVYRSLLHSSADAIVIYDLEGRVNYISPAFSTLFGWTFEELKGEKIPFLLESEKKATMAIIKELVEYGTPCHGFETKRYTKDGHILDVSISASRYDDHKGHSAGTLVVLRDISERKRLEAQLQHAQRMEAIGTLAGGVAHDFNNLMMGMLGNISLMLFDAEPSHPYYDKLKNIEKMIESGSKLTSQLLGYARRGKYEVKPVNLNQIVKESSDTFGRIRKEITIHREFAADLCAMEVDESQIQQVLMNLYVNAADAMPGGGDLILKTMNVAHRKMKGRSYEVKPGNYVMLKVTDNGTGMDENTMKRIFEPFFTTKEMGRGTGLGLASAYGIIKGHGGYIDVDSKKGFGTSFYMYLPASDKTIPKTFDTSNQIMESRGTILLVDDEEIIVDVGAEMLKKIGYTVLKAQSGKEAIEVYRKNIDKIDLVILDMIMPDIGGGEAYDKIKAINPKVKVLLSSGYTIDGQATEIMERGCNGFIQKPYNIKALSNKTREIFHKD
ncbi:MAG: PAS domain S-box protein [Proteobacteria bacterium]|nr:PAS domain S-box protein [Pseudomonadota bacterium]